MRQTRSRTLLASLAVLGVIAAVHVPVRAQQEQMEQLEPAVPPAIQYLRGRAANQQAGETALIALAMLKADIPKTDPVLASCIATIQKRFPSGSYTPQRTGGHDIYEAAVVAMALSNLDSEAHRSEINAAATYLIGLQKANGSWDYNHRSRGDCSISQYALLGLWESENSGVNVPPSVWDRAAGWYLAAQARLGAGITTAMNLSISTACR